MQTSSRLDENCLTYVVSRFEKHGFEKKKNVIAAILKKKIQFFFLYL